MTSPFDPTRALVFDLAQGQVRDREGNARLNLPALALARLLESASTDGVRDFGETIGSELGRHVGISLGRDAQSASIETWTEHLGGHLALLGLGDLAVERWGKALVFSVSGVPSGLIALVGDVLKAALQRSLGRELILQPFDEGSRASYLALSAEGQKRVSEMLKSGAGLGEVVEQLQKRAA